jgi:hypothetical protein
LKKAEARNPQFDFLNPDHGYFAYFQALVEAYVNLINPRPEMLEDLAQVSVLRLSVSVSVSVCVSRRV